MMHWVGDWTWWAWIPMAIGMLVFWGLVAWAVVALVRFSGDGGDSRRGAHREGTKPEGLLQERLARGEIDVGEYEERLAAIRGRRGAATG